MRLIDGDALYDYIQKEKAWKQDTMRRPRYDQGKYDAYYEMLQIIDECPTFDAVPVVRCAECQKWHTPDCHAGHEQAAADFCSHGERRDDPHA